MRKVDATSIDLNLLKLFDALVRECSVTGAGQRLGLSQPAASRALARLRRMLGDPLVVRDKLGLALTPRAQALAGPVAALLDNASAIVSPAAFVPAAATGAITIAAHDHLSMVLLPGLLKRFEREAPGLSLHMAPVLGDNLRLVEQGGADLALGLFEAAPGSLHRRTLYTDGMVCLLRTQHPLLATALTLETYTGMRHVAVTISGIGESTVDSALGALGRTRTVALRVPHFLAAAMLVADSDMVLTVPRRLAQLLVSKLPLLMLEAPVQLARLSPAMLWHPRLHGDPAHAWVRHQLVEVVAGFDQQA